MEILVAVIAFAGALLAAVAAGALVRRLHEEPEGWLIAWAVAAGLLCLSLGVIGVGHLIGFGTVTFKIFQLTGSLLAPLWLAIGLIQLLAEKTPPKFGAWLFGVGFTVTASVILLMDPLKSEEMGKSLPDARAHWAIIPDYLLLAAHAIAALIMAGAVLVAALRWRDGDEYDTDNLHACLVIVPSGLALMGAMRFAVPGVFTTVLLIVAAAAIWYTVLRPLAPYEDDDEYDDFDAEPSQERRPTGRRAEPEPVTASPQGPATGPAPPRRSGLGDLVAEYRATGETDYAARMSPGDRGPSTGETGYASRRQPPDPGPSTGYVMNGHHTRHATPAADSDGPATGAIYPAADVFTPRVPATGPQPAVPPAPQGPSAKLSPKIYGMLTVFTLMDGAGAAFDRLAEQTVEAVRRGEPDTLVYACHAVKSAPLQRIVYEIYRDEVAYRDHQRQPHVERFINERQAMVLATNVIELDINAAKVVPLPTVMF
ncbi:antibiotic biosynthesis monooxygenase [Nonomuraea sp. MCN248]|uniref:Antibiotic biosynthesis monooxygenase n=1 Tax=Nonomuraea corallina TaxID=2989783 RepID=A0ABT4S7M9_9ACTN|nr:antibiotic biosynthesis monooxygenase [Nonomuraea corallina]MDA0633182.1 antibiotic biosynthesis monooxygenase [Nonomuraea corallina]